MTQTACQILIRIGTIRHLWKSIKSLRKLSKEESTTEITPSVHPDILEIWSLLGLHTLYMSTGIEQVFKYIPLYFYVKMIGLTIFFFLPSASNRNVPAQFLFESVLVRGVDSLHSFLDNDYNGWTKRQLYILPWRLVDLIFPGMLGYSPLIGWKECKKRRDRVLLLRKEQLLLSREVTPYSPRYQAPVSEAIGSPKSPVFIHTVDSSEQDSVSLLKPVSSSLPTVNESNARTHFESEVTPPSSKSNRTFVEKTSRWSPKRSTSSIFSPIAQSRVHASSMNLQNFSRSHKKRYTFGSSEKKNRKRSSKKRDQSSSTKKSTPDPKLKSQKEQVSSTNTSPSPVTPTGKAESTAAAAPHTPPPTKSYTIPSSFLALSTPTFETITSFLSPRSLANSLRKIVTGSAHIRLRDFLFDLDLPLSSRIYSRRRKSESHVDNVKRENVESDGEVSKESKNRRKSTGDVLHRHTISISTTESLDMAQAEKSTGKKKKKVSKRIKSAISHAVGKKKKNPADNKNRIVKKIDFDEVSYNMDKSVDTASTITFTGRSISSVKRKIKSKPKTPTNITVRRSKRIASRGGE